MHTVIKAECTGCRLCLAPCPVDCIAMVETGETRTHDERKLSAAQYRRRRAARLAREHAAHLEAEPEKAAEDRKHATIARAMQRARERLR
jgi:electron transport complex protein RnfB